MSRRYRTRPASVTRQLAVEIVGEKSVEVGTTDSKIDARLMTIERNGLRSFVLYWYFWDDKVCTTRSAGHDDSLATGRTQSNGHR